MKKITLQLSPRQLNTLAHIFSYVNQVFSKEREKLVLKSILDDVVIKTQKKNVEVMVKTQNLFAAKTKTKLTFKFHEADALEKFLLMAQENIAMSPYDGNVVLFLISKINQQLA